MVELEIDGQKVRVAEGTSIIDAADSVGIYIPRYCYHKKLSIAANCRMCLVEVEGVGKPLPACATTVTQDMKVMTRSAKAMQAQRAVLEFLLINHPLDCPICDQGGVCELQDYAMGYGQSHSDFNEGKLSVASEDIGPLVETWMTRCIKCTRCVRFGEEVAGLRELGVVNRGDHSEIGTYVKKFVDSELSANIADICPVGALTIKPIRYEQRNWEVTEHPSVAVHDCVGSNIYVHTQGRAHVPQRRAINIVPRENDAINETWISDRDRFAYLGLQHEQRCLTPKMKRKGQWQTVSYERALPEIVDRIRAIVAEQGSDQLAFLASPSSTTQELYLMQKLARSLGCHNIDHRLRQQDFSPQNPLPRNALGMQLSDVEDSDAIVLVGANVRFEQPMVAHRIRKAAADQAYVSVINPVDFDFTFTVRDKVIDANIVNGLAQLAKALGVNQGLEDVVVGEACRHMAQTLQQAQQPVLFLGLYAQEHAAASQLKVLADQIASVSKVKIGYLTHGANSAGAWLAGALPHCDASGQALANPGKNVKELLTTDPVRCYVLLNFEPEHDVAFSSAAMSALKQAGLVVSLSLFDSPALAEVADFILPIAPFSENEGDIYNVTGMQQTLKPTSVPHEQAKPAWKILRVLANFLELDGFEFNSVQSVMDEVLAQGYRPQQQTRTYSGYQPPAGLHRYAYVPMYDSDAMVRRSEPLAQTHLKAKPVIEVNSRTAEQMHLSAGQSVLARQDGDEMTLTLGIDDRLSDHTVGLAAGIAQTAGFGCGHAAIELQEVS